MGEAWIMRSTPAASPLFTAACSALTSLCVYGEVVMGVGLRWFGSIEGAEGPAQRMYRSMDHSSHHCSRRAVSTYDAPSGLGEDCSVVLRRLRWLGAVRGRSGSSGGILLRCY